jgi:AraC-like DNA-binding protein
VPGTVRDDTRYWKAAVLGGVELLHGRYRNRAFPRHAHDTYVVSVVTEGAETLRLRDGTHRVPPLGIVTLNPGTWHANDAGRDQPVGLRSFYLDERAIRELAGLPTDGRSVDVQFRDPVVLAEPRLALALLRLHRRLEREPAGGAEEEAAYDALRALLARCAGLGATAAFDDDRRLVGRLKAYLVDHLTDGVRLEELARLTGRSSCHLLRAFRDAVGVTPHQFQTQMRIRRAAALLRAGWPVGAAALDVGFADQSHLTRHFTRSMGVPPGRFARNVKNVQDAAMAAALRS